MENNRMLKRTGDASSAPKVVGVSGLKGAPPLKTDNPLISQEGLDYLNYRIQQEEYSARIYKSMAMWLDDKGYLGAAKQWNGYSAEEMGHADIARKYILSFGLQPLTPVLDQPEQNYPGGLPEIIQKSYDHEIEISSQIKDLASKALMRGDHIMYELALGYLKEQVEEMGKMQNWMDRLEAFGTDKIALRLLDDEMMG